MIRRPPISPLFPYPTLFRSCGTCPVDGEDENRVPHAARHDGHRQPPGPTIERKRDAHRGRGDEWSARRSAGPPEHGEDRKSTRLNSSHSQISYAVFCLKKKT